MLSHLYISYVDMYKLYMAGVVVLSENFLLRHLSRVKRHDFDIIAQLDIVIECMIPIRKLK